MHRCVIHCKQASLELQINAPARFTSTPSVSEPPSPSLFLYPLSLPLRNAHSVSICSQPVLGSLSSNRPALVPGRWAKASLDRLRRKDGGKGGWGGDRGRAKATTQKVDSDLCVVFLQQVAQSYLADDAC